LRQQNYITRYKLNNASHARSLQLFKRGNHQIKFSLLRAHGNQAALYLLSRHPPSLA